MKKKKKKLENSKNFDTRKVRITKEHDLDMVVIGKKIYEIYAIITNFDRHSSDKKEEKKEKSEKSFENSKIIRS